MNAPSLSAAILLCLAPAAHAQLQLDWYTIDGGGGTSSGGGITVTGTIGQHDAATTTGGGIECAGGFWTAFAGGTACYPNCDGSTASPALTGNDFVCFLTRFTQQDPYANCDQSSTAPVLNANDFICFLGAFAIGCS
jgi:hypothetical protein